MARVLIVPCGCRGRALASALVADGHAVRGTTRGAHVEEIRAAGAEPYVGDPDRIGTLMDALHGVTVVVWLAGGLEIPEGRLRMLWEKLVDTPVRGVVYEGALPEGEAVARTAARTWQIPLEVLTADPADHAAWLAAAAAAVARLIEPPRRQSAVLLPRRENRAIRHRGERREGAGR